MNTKYRIFVPRHIDSVTGVILNLNSVQVWQFNLRLCNLQLQSGRIGWAKAPTAFLLRLIS